MLDFQYCIWLVPSDRYHEWYSYTNGCEPHITIFSHLNEEDVTGRLAMIQDIDMDVDLVGELNNFSVQGFSALHFNVTTTKELDWWPKDAHVSFHYKYDKITKEEMDKLSGKVKKRSCRFSQIKVKKCSGHFLQW
jgi:hypothetical protein